MHIRSIRTHPQMVCRVCGNKGTLLYRDLSDRSWDISGNWNLEQCQNENCRLVWLNPCPVDADIPQLYLDYFTHAFRESWLTKVWKLVNRKVLAATLGYDQHRAGLVGRLAAACRPLAEWAGGTVLWQPAEKRGRLLDVGCGRGDFLATMKSLGWQAQGVEPDLKAAQVASDRGLEVAVGTMSTATFPSEHFDLITLSHVVEHLSDPLQTLRRCYELLKPRGRICIVTPNAESTLAKLFRSNWFAWDPPRHLLVFTAPALTDLVEQAGFTVQSLTTPARMAYYVWRLSNRLRGGRRIPGGRVPFNPYLVIRALIYHFSVNRKSRESLQGDELLMLAVKK